MQSLAPTVIASTAVAAASVTAEAVDFGTLAFVFAAVLISVVCAIVAYILAMRQARGEIVHAFEDHIKELHSNHVNFLRKYGKTRDRKD